jgi:hypothetical protein
MGMHYSCIFPFLAPAFDAFGRGAWPMLHGPVSAISDVSEQNGTFVAFFFKSLLFQPTLLISPTT